MSLVPKEIFIQFMKTRTYPGNFYGSVQITVCMLTMDQIIFSITTKFNSQRYNGITAYVQFIVTRKEDFGLAQWVELPGSIVRPDVLLAFWQVYLLILGDT